MFHFYNTCLNSLNTSSQFSGGIIISSTGFVFTILLSYKLVTLSILFPKISPVLWTTFLEAVFKESSSVSNNCFLYSLDKVPSNDKNPYPLTYFLVLGSTEHCFFCQNYIILFKFKSGFKFVSRCCSPILSYFDY